MNEKAASAAFLLVDFNLNCLKTLTIFGLAYSFF